MDEYLIDDSAPFKERLAQLRHDLKTPVGHIIGYSEMLQEEFEEESWDEFTQDLVHIHNSGERLVSLIEEYLGPSKETIDQIDFSDTQFNLRLQLNHITGYCEMLRELAEEEERSDLFPDLDRINQASQIFSTIVENKLSLTTLASNPHSTQAANESEQLDDLEELPSTIFQTTLGEGGEILIVDDNAVNLDLLSRRLARQGYNTQTVGSGKEAFSLLEKHKFDLILLDLVMPGMSGIDVLKRLKNDSTLRNIPVIILSALDDMTKIVQCVLLGADDYIFKPFNPVLLKARISASLEKSRLRRQVVPKLKVFISSPGDVINERRIVRLIINQLNEELVEKVFLTPIFWEDEPLLATDTFQSQIYPAKDCDIYLGIFWSRLGSPLPKHIKRADGSCYLSGSEYEFEDAIDGKKERNKPDILVYKKMQEPMVGLNNRDEIMQRLEQNERLEGFIKKWFMTPDGESYSGAFHGFDDADSFESLVYKHLKKLVLNQLEEITSTQK